MRLASLPATSTPDPIAWTLVELHGPRAATDAPVDVLEVSAYGDDSGREASQG